MHRVANTFAIIFFAVATISVAGATGCASTPTFMAYLQVASKQRVQEVGPSRLRPGSTTENSGVLKGWPYHFTRSQLRRLRRAGCRFNTSDFNYAHELHRSGFTAAELVRAYEDVKRYVSGDRSQLRALAAYRVAGFDLGRYAKYRASSDSLTAYYNQTYAGGTGVRTAGWALTGIGLSMVGLFAGLIGLFEGSRQRCVREHRGDDYECGSVADGAILALLGSLAGVGGLTAAVGGVILLAKPYNPHRHLASPVLDNADAETLRDFHRWRRIADGKPPPPSLSLSPLLTRGGGGITLRLRF